ncbi:hypothetical protein [Stetteria hydrogenophila]
MGKGRRIDEYLGGERGAPRGASGCDSAVIERAAEIAAEKVVARFLSKVVDEIEAIRREVESLRVEVERLSKLVQSLGRSGGKGFRSRRTGDSSELAEVLSREGYIFASEARAKLGIGPLRLKSEAEKLGAVVIEGEGDVAVVDRRAYEEFVAMLSSVKTSDPVEASKQLGRYERLFNELRRGGRLYFDARRAMWRIL